MYLLQTTTVNWYSPLISSALSMILFFFIAYLLFKVAISAATKEQRRQTKITNLLLIEQLKKQGVSDSKIKEILDTK